MEDARMPEALANHFDRLAQHLGPIGAPVYAFLAGDLAIFCHTQKGSYDRIEIAWSHRVAIPPHLRSLEVTDPDDASKMRSVAFGDAYPNIFAPYPPEWEANGVEIGTFGDISVRLIDPTDLAVSLLYHLDDWTRDKLGLLFDACGLDPELFRLRAEEAMGLYTGGCPFVESNLVEALGIARKVRTERFT
jgi:hypothetical protein